MLTIRLKRIGKRHDPAYRVVVTDSREGPKSGRFIETLGHYNPRSKERVINAERARYWLGQGAGLSATAHNMFVKLGIINESKREKVSANVLKKNEGNTPADGEAAEKDQSEGGAAEAPSEEAPEADSGSEEGEASAPADGSTGSPQDGSEQDSSTGSEQDSSTGSPQDDAEQGKQSS